MNVKSLLTMGMKCPRPLLEIHRAIKEISPGERLEVAADDPAFRLDVEAWCRRTGHKLLSLVSRPDRIVATIEKVPS